MGEGLDRLKKMEVLERTCDLVLMNLFSTVDWWVHEMSEGSKQCINKYSKCKTWRHWRTVWRSQWRATWTTRSAFCRSRGAHLLICDCWFSLVLYNVQYMSECEWHSVQTTNSAVLYFTNLYSYTMYCALSIAFAWRWTWTWVRAKSTRLYARWQRPSSAPSARRTWPSAPRAPNARALVDA